MVWEERRDPSSAGFRAQMIDECEILRTRPSDVGSLSLDGFGSSIRGHRCKGVGRVEVPFFGAIQSPDIKNGINGKPVEIVDSTSGVDRQDQST